MCVKLIRYLFALVSCERRNRVPDMYNTRLTALLHFNYIISKQRENLFHTCSSVLYLNYRTTQVHQSICNYLVCQRIKILINDCLLLVLTAGMFSGKPRLGFAHMTATDRQLNYQIPHKTLKSHKPTLHPLLCIAVKCCMVTL